MNVKILNTIKETSWDKLNKSDSPFLSYEFFSTLEQSHSIGLESGWQPLYFEEDNHSLLYSFIKNHSYGEYIFDWDWAAFYQSHQEPYYPKLTSMIPFTSATTPHFIAEKSDKIMEAYEKFYNDNEFFSSNFLFLQEEELSFFRSYNYMIRESFQYHFTNNGYTSFEDFLSKIKHKKAKQMRKERVFSPNIKISQFSGDELTPSHGRQMYLFYSSTIEDKQAIPYLNEAFFKKIFSFLKDQICYIEASENGIPIAGALYFFCSERLYGRYWGTISDIPNLHFELCYYQGIDFCIKHNIPVFEAGAQGEHKIARGFKGTKTFSAHKFKNRTFHNAISEYINKEKSYIDMLLPELNEKLPYRVN